MLINHSLYYPLYRNEDKFIVLVTGGRGCEDPNTHIMMYDRSIKRIKDIRIGDRVMGDDGTPREVLNTLSGRSTMYNVHQSNGEDYIVNDSHILTLFERGRVVDVPIKEYLDKRSHTIYKGVRVNFIDFSSSLTDIQVTEKGEGDWCGMILDGNHRYCHADGTITHNSGKTTATSTFIERLTFELGHDENGRKVSHQILYSRYTMTSAGMSIIPEVMDKIEADGTGKYFAKSGQDIVNVMTGSHIMFRGIRTSSGNQTAKLKSIKGLTVFVCDEAEEFVNEDDFEKIMFSIRQQGLKNMVIIIMNPSDSNHFIYQKYIKDTHKVVEYDGVPVQISTHPNVLHIHTSYLDNIQYLAPNFIKEAQAMKENDPERYGHIFMGRWADVAEGAIFKKWGIVKEFPEHAKKVALAMDFGYSCFSGDTLITTQRGQIPIKDVVIGDLVLTREGYKKVRNNIYKGKKDVVTKHIITTKGGVTITATKEHQILANGIWKRYECLTNSDVLVTLSNLMEGCIDEERNPSIIGVDGTKTENIIVNSYITRCTNTIMEKFRQVSLSTILTKIHLIIRKKIWLRLQEETTCGFMTRCLNTMQRIQKTVRNVNSPQITIRNECKLQKSDLKSLDLNANIAKKSLSLQIEGKDSARQDATSNGNYTQNATNAKGFVLSAEKLSNAESVQLTKHAHENVLTNANVLEVETLSQTKTDTYDLEVEGVHEYFANGILVHNCDPTAIVMIGVVDNAMYAKEICYKSGMLSSDIIKTLRPYAQDGLFVYSESADPRLIDEIALGGIVIYPVQKGAGSIQAGLDKMLTMELYVTEDSLNLQEEMRNYTWDKDKDGRYISTPIDAYNHLIDSWRYYVLAVLLGKVMKPKNVTKERLGIF